MDRRRFLTTAAAALTTGGIAGCMSSTGKKNRNETANRSRSNNTGSTTTSESMFQQQIENVRSATQKYTDPKKALRDGFKVSGPYVPGMGWHFIHTGRLQDAAKNGFDLERPPILTYIDDEGLKLASVEYGAPSDSIPKNPDLFSKDESGKWHTHEKAEHVFATPDGEATSPEDISFEEWTDTKNWVEFRPVENLNPGDTVERDFDGDGKNEKRTVDVSKIHPDLRSLHVWIHVDNPAGVFNPVNPEFTAEGAGHHGGGSDGGGNHSH